VRESRQKGGVRNNVRSRVRIRWDNEKWPIHSRTRGMIFPSDRMSDTGGKSGAHNLVIGGQDLRIVLGGTGRGKAG
jgi:hypothetical protein